MLKNGLVILCCAGLLTFIGCAQSRYKQPSADRYLEEANQALRKNKCWEAQKLLRNLLSDFPGSHLVDRAQYKLGFAYLCDKDYVTAVFEFERLLNEFPTSPWVDEARHQIGMSYYHQSRSIHHDQDETLKAIREFERFIEDFPESDLVADTRARIAELRNKLAAKNVMVAENYMQWEMYDSARRYGEIVLAEFDDTPFTQKARFILAQAEHKLGKLETAMEMLSLLLADDVPENLKQQIAEEIEEVQKSMEKQKSTSKKTLLKATEPSAASNR